MKLKNCENWKAVCFDDRTILKDDTRFMWVEQVKSLLEVEVEPTRRKGFFRAVEKEV